MLNGNSKWFFETFFLNLFETIWMNFLADVQECFKLELLTCDKCKYASRKVASCRGGDDEAQNAAPQEVRLGTLP
jgi:hypothetical protein